MKRNVSSNPTNFSGGSVKRWLIVIIILLLLVSLSTSIFFEEVSEIYEEVSDYFVDYDEKVREYCVDGKTEWEAVAVEKVYIDDLGKSIEWKDWRYVADDGMVVYQKFSPSLSRTIFY